MKFKKPVITGSTGNKWRVDMRKYKEIMPFHVPIGYFRKYIAPIARNTCSASQAKRLSIISAALPVFLNIIVAPLLLVTKDTAKRLI